MHALKANGEVEVNVYPFFNSAVNGGEWPSSLSGRIGGEKNSYALQKLNHDISVVKAVTRSLYKYKGC